MGCIFRYSSVTHFWNMKMMKKALNIDISVSNGCPEISEGMGVKRRDTYMNGEHIYGQYLHKGGTWL